MMEVRNIDIEDLEVSPEAFEWMQSTGAKTIGQLVDLFSDPDGDPNQSQFQSAEDEMLIGDNVCHALGSLIWKKIAEKN